MNVSLDECKKIAKDIAIDMIEAGIADDRVYEFAASKIADRIYDHERDVLRAAHAEYVESVKRCGY